MASTLTVVFDVRGLSDAQLNSLIACVSAQAEAYDDGQADVDGYDGSYPDVPIISTTIL